MNKSSRGRDSSENESISRSFLKSYNFYKHRGLIGEAIFISLLGKWAFHRDLHDHHNNKKTSRVIGTICFEKTDRENELMYCEQGKYYDSDSNRESHRVWKKYLFKYNPKNDNLSVFFPETKALFHSLKLEKKMVEDELIWQGSGIHYCNQDIYKTFYHFWFSGAVLNKIRITHLVHGPKKDYTSTTLCVQL